VDAEGYVALTAGLEQETLALRVAHREALEVAEPLGFLEADVGDVDVNAADVFEREIPNG
jgi:hypothetical protein